MNCQSFREIVHEIDRPNGVEVGTLDAALGHAQACTRCARHLHRSRQVASRLRALAFADESQQASTRTEEHLLAAFRAQSRRRLRWRAVAGWIAAAAALALAVAGGTLWRHASRSLWLAAHSEAARGTVSAPAAARSQALSSPGETRRDVRPSVLNAAHTGGAKATGRLQPEPETAGEFIPLPFADDDAPLGSGEVVRIRLSEADLGLLGLSVSQEAYAQPLTADVVIGEDGVARAIRFVE